VVPSVEVPDLLDRTAAQARRIVEDLGLRVKERVAARGLPGRVVDQQPALGERLEKGEFVLVWVGPPDDRAPAPEAPVAPAPSEPTAPAPPAREGGASPSASGSAAPRPIAPLEQTVLPRDATFALGFSWRPVAGADAYLVEVEEEGAADAWIGTLRKPVRATAAALEVERLDARAARRLRWRVRAVFGGREGAPSAWIVMR
jgi:hypothetical protein